VRLSRYGIERYQPGPTTTPTVPAADWEASFDGGITWHAAEVISSAPTWLVAGPLAATPGDAYVLPDLPHIVPAIRFANAPELIVRDETFDDDQRPPTIHLID
jgi:hypothetical protein